MKVESFKTVVLLCALLGFFVHPVNADNTFSEARTKAMQSPVAPLLPRETFRWQPALEQVMLSPNGAHLAYRMKKDRHVELWRYDIATQTHKRVVSVKHIEEMHWSADSKYLFYANAEALFLVDMQATHLAKKIYDLHDINEELIWPDPDKEEVFWVSRYLPRKQQHTLVRVETNGTEQTVFTSEHPLSGLLTENGQLTVISQWVGNQIQIAQVDDVSLTVLMRCRVLAPCQAHHWDEQNHTLLVSTHFDQDVLSLFSVDVRTGKKQLIHQEPGKQFDIHRVSTTEDGIPQLVSYRTEYADHYALSASAQTTLNKISAKTNSRFNMLHVSRDQTVWLVADADPAHTATHFFVYQAQTDSWQSPFSHIPTARMDARWVAPRVPFWYAASDGMKLQGYLTLPLGKDPGKVPLVVNPHGGPWTRSSGAFNRNAQFLANRGYAVFEPNFRSSTGLGYNYVVSANKDYGDGRVQRDIIEGLDYLLDAGIGDPDQLAVAGHSFGGFSALAALAFTPERFRVAFAGAAPSNLANTMLHYSKRMPAFQTHRTQLRIRELMVDIDDSADVNRLYQQSPDKHWRNISRPLFLWAGERDERVSVEGIRDMALRLESAGRTVTLISDPTEGHSPEKEIAREAYLYMLEHALARHLNGRADQYVSADLRRYLDKYVLIDSAGLNASSLTAHE